jgi:hypothetical protein
MSRLLQKEMFFGRNEHADVQSSSIFYQAHNSNYL